MPTTTYIPLANLTLGSNAATVTFSSISQSYRDLVLVIEGRSTITENPTMRFNGVTGTNYPMVRISGNGSTPSSGSNNSAYFFVGGAVTFNSASKSTSIVNIMDYSVTDKHKPVIIRTDGVGTATEGQVGRWANTAAINTISLFFNFGALWSSGTSFALYGIAA
jgi:hypothetical protein